MHSIWNERQSFHVTEQKLCDQARMIRRNGWLTELQLADIKKRLAIIIVGENGDNETYVCTEPVEENDTVNLINHGSLTSATMLELIHQDRELIEEMKSTIENDLDTELQ